MADVGLAVGGNRPGRACRRLSMKARAGICESERFDRDGQVGRCGSQPLPCSVFIFRDIRHPALIGRVVPTLYPALLTVAPLLGILLQEQHPNNDTLEGT